MDPGERTTGTRDENYALISVLYHALHGAENCENYAVDAEAAGDGELAAFFREAEGIQVGMAEEAKGLLGILEGAPEVGRYSAGAMREDVRSEGAGTVPTGDVPPRTAQSGWETPPPRPRRATPAEKTPPSEDAASGAPVVPPEEAEPPDTPLPPGEEHPERRTP